MSWCDPRGLRACPPGLPELLHGLNHPGDALASQFDQILNLSEIFAPLLPLDPAVTFYAPLDYTLVDLRGAPETFLRDSSAVWRRDDGALFLLPSNQARFEQGQFLKEPSGTNKCTNFNADVDEALTNISTTGNAVASRMADDFALQAAGLDTLVGSFVVDVDNLGGGGTSEVTVAGNVGNTNVHTLSVYARNLGGDCFLRFSNGGSAVPIQNGEYQRIISTGTPGNANVSLQVQVAADSRLRFVLNQLEESRVVTSPIITQGAAGFRAKEELTYGNSDQFFNQTEGMALVTRRADFDATNLTTAAESDGIISLTTGDGSVARFVNNTSNLDRFQTTDGTAFLNVVPVAPLDKTSAYIAVRWRSTPAELQIGFRQNGTWSWSSVAAYDGSFETVDIMTVGIDLDLGPTRFSNLQIYNEDKGLSWIEANYP